MKRTVLALVLAALVRVGLDVLRLAGDPQRYANGEDAYNASAGWFIGHTGMWDQLFQLQYKAFCGGCVVHMAAAAVLIGDHVWTWRLVALAWTIAGLIAGFFAVDRWAGRAPAWAFVLLYCVPATGMSDLGLMSWGNHQESGVFVLLVLALVDRPVWSALVLGLGVWFCRTTLYALVLLPWLVWRRPWAMLAFGLGCLPMLVPAAAGDRGSYDLATIHTSLDPAFLWTRLKPLLVPERLGVYLVPNAPNGAALATVELVAAAVAVVLARRPIFPLLASVFAAGWALSGFRIPRIVEDMGILQLRYHAPWMLLLVLLVASAAGTRVGKVLVAAVLAAHLAGQVTSARPPRWDSLLAPVVDVNGLVGVARPRLDPARLRAAEATDPRVAEVLRRLGEGR